MHSKATALTALAAIFTAVSCSTMQVTIYDSTDCTGDAQVLFTDEPQYGGFCFNGAGGNSWSDLTINFGTGAEFGDMTTWSGTNCEGSSSNDNIVNSENPSTEGCVGIPFGSVFWVSAPN